MPKNSVIHCPSPKSTRERSEQQRLELVLGARRTTTHASKKGSEKVMWRVLGRVRRRVLRRCLALGFFYSERGF